MEDLKLLRSQSGDLYADYNDIAFNEYNDLELISGTSRTRQNIIKILLTTRGANLKYPHYGTYLQRIGDLPHDMSQKQVLIRESIIQALKYLQIIEESDDEEEVLKSVELLQFIPSQEDPREYTINIKIRLENDELITIILEESQDAK